MTQYWSKYFVYFNNNSYEIKAWSNVVAILVLYKSGNNTTIDRQLIKRAIVTLLLGHKKKEISRAQDLHFFLAHGLQMIWNVNLFFN